MSLFSLPNASDFGFFADDLTSPTSSILTKEVVDAYAALAGDFHPCLPFALLEARRFFRAEQRNNPSDADENAGRKLACEAIARKLVARAEMQEQYALLSKRWTCIDDDNDETLPLSGELFPPLSQFRTTDKIHPSALESAVDQHATFFLSSNEAQRCTFALWRGLLVQNVTDNDNIVYDIYKAAKDQQGFLGHWNPQRVAVPRYQFFFRVALWIIFIICYTVAIQTPERGFAVEDVILYVQVAGYMLEDIVRVRLCLHSLLLCLDF